MRLSTIAGAASVIALLSLASPASAATCESLKSLSLPHGTITQARNVDAGKFSSQGPGGPVMPAAAKLPSVCRIAATLTPSRDSDIKIEVWMPGERWNGKFLGV